MSWRQMTRWIGLLGIGLLLAAPCRAEDDFSFSHYLLDNVLHKHVMNGLVDYDAMKQDPDLDKYIASLATVDMKKQIHGRNAEIALWINAYNAMILKGICDAWPINKVEQHGGIFTRVYTVAGEKVTPDDIVNDILRKRFGDPRILFALCMGAKSSPPLIRKAYFSGDLDSDLDSQVSRYLNADDNIKLVRIKNEVGVPELFEWYRQDFEKVHGVHAFIGHYLKDDSAGRFIAVLEPHLQFNYFDWSVNAAPKPAR